MTRRQKAEAKEDTMSERIEDLKFLMTISLVTLVGATLTALV